MLAPLRAVAKGLADRAVEGADVADQDAAALALSCVAVPVAVPEMGRVLAGGSDAGVVLIGALARLGGPSALNTLRSAQASSTKRSATPPFGRCGHCATESPCLPKSPTDAFASAGRENFKAA